MLKKIMITLELRVIVQLQPQNHSPFSVIITGVFPYLLFTCFINFLMPHGTMCSQLEAAYEKGIVVDLA